MEIAAAVSTPIQPQSAAAAARPGKSAGAPGQLAKIAVADAKAAGAALPKNAQGMAASAIAKGADPASVFAAMIPPPPEPAPELGLEPAPETAPDSAPTTPDAADAAAAQENETATAYQTALDLLSPPNQTDEPVNLQI